MPEAGSEELRSEVIRALQVRHVSEPENWSRRFKAHQEKMKSGRSVSLAEVVRNLVLRERNTELSSGERQLLQLARTMLVSDLSTKLALSPTEAFDLIADSLSDT